MGAGTVRKSIFVVHVFVTLFGEAKESKKMQMKRQSSELNIKRWNDWSLTKRIKSGIIEESHRATGAMTFLSDSRYNCTKNSPT